MGFLSCLPKETGMMELVWFVTYIYNFTVVLLGFYYLECDQLTARSIFKLFSEVLDKETG